MDFLKQYPILFTSGCVSLGAQCVMTSIFAKKKVFDKQPGFMAHQVVALTLMILLTVVGGKIWFFPDKEAATIASTLDGRIHGVTFGHEFLLQVAAGMLLFWDIPTGVAVKSLCTPASMGHHVVMCLVCFSGLNSQIMYHYAGFFLGFCELSSIPLQIVDIFHPDHFPELTKQNPALEKLNENCRIAFAGLFMLVRAIYFPYVMFTQAIPDIVASLRLGTTPSGEMIGLATIGTGGVILTCLQVYWAFLIVKQVQKMLSGGAGKEKKDKAK